MNPLLTSFLGGAGASSGSALGNTAGNSANDSQSSSGSPLASLLAGFNSGTGGFSIVDLLGGLLPKELRDKILGSTGIGQALGLGGDTAAKNPGNIQGNLTPEMQAFGGGAHRPMNPMMAQLSQNPQLMQQMMSQYGGR